MLEITVGSKIGIHNNQFGNGVQFIKDGLAKGVKFPVFKSVNNGGAILEVKRLSPETITIWRIYRNPDLDGYNLDVNSDIERIATERVKEILDNSSLEERVATDYFECHNENRPQTDIGWQRLAELQKLFVIKLAAHGLKAAVFGLNCGTPEYREMRLILETGVMERINQFSGIMTIHEGILGSPGVNDDDDALWGIDACNIPDAPGILGAGCLGFRYRYWLHLAEVLKITMPPIVISEHYPTRHTPYTNLSVEGMVDIYQRMDDEVSQDPEIVGVLPFTIGGPGWDDQRMESYYPALIDYMWTVKDLPNETRQPPAPTTAIVKKNFRNLRETFPLGNILATVGGGQRVKLISKQDGWYKVRYEVEGWMHESGLII